MKITYNVVLIEKKHLMQLNFHSERSYFYSFSLSRRLLLFSETNYVASKRHLLARYCCFWWQESGIDGGAFTQTSVFFVRIILVFFVYIILVFFVSIILVFFIRMSVLILFISRTNFIKVA